MGAKSGEGTTCQLAVNTHTFRKQCVMHTHAQITHHRQGISHYRRLGTHRWAHRAKGRGSNPIHELVFRGNYLRHISQTT